VPKDTRWDQNLSVTADAESLVGHAGAVLLRKLADQCGLTAALGTALARTGKFPLIDRGVTLVSVAVAIVLGATSMSDIALLDHQGLVFGPPPSDTTVRRTLELADDKTLRKIAKARAKIRAHVWELVAATAAGFPWLAIAGKVLTGWLVIDMDATLITAHSPALAIPSLAGILPSAEVGGCPGSVADVKVRLLSVRWHLDCSGGSKVGGPDGAAGGARRGRGGSRGGWSGAGPGGVPGGVPAGF
jgi:hypothetical protein